MKKYLFIIAIATIFASCSDSDSLKKDVQNSNNDAISFESYTSKLTRAENSTAGYGWEFFDHHTTFQVWGYKNTATVDKPVFNGDVVTVAEPDPTVTSPRVFTYTYSPLRFWDKAASMYEYYAAAPSGTDGGWTFESTGINTANITDEGGQNKGYFTTSSTLTPANLSTSSNLVYTNSFKGSGDIDKLIAEKSTVPYANFRSKVNLSFIHILSRLNITIKADENLVAPTGNVNKQEIKMVSLLVKNLNAAGNFSEATNPVPAGTITRWSGQGTPKDYTAVPNTVLTKDAQWVLQSLVIPQNAPFEIVALDGAEHASTPATYYASVEEYNAAKGLTGTDAKDADWWSTATDAEKTKTPGSTTTVKAVTDGTEPYLVLTYTIQQTHDANGDEIDENDLKPAETFVAYFNLANAFGLQSGNLAFNEGWQNTLNITIKPATIEFCAKVAEWSTYERGVTVD